tara:strand:+ start:324 stop:1322 length:999 start_codon:yes stop_codon:yes gene_type:complete
MNRILITGACGSIGEALVDRLIQDNNVVCAFDNSEDGLFNLKNKFSNSKDQSKLKIFLGDVRDKKRLFQAISGVNEVYHCAALKHVELSEYNPFEALQTNINGTSNVIDAAIENKVSKLLITSSDKAVNPSSMMGATKLLAEKLAINSNNYTGSDDIKIGCVRFGNVWDTNGSVGRIFKNQLINNADLTITDPKMTRFFIYIEDAVSLCLHACDNLVGGEIFISDMGATSIAKIAEEFNSLNPKINIVETGSKAGEKLYEELFTEVESQRTYNFNDLYVILPDSLDIDSTRFAALDHKYNNGSPISTALRSDSKISRKINTKDLVKRIMDES